MASEHYYRNMAETLLGRPAQSAEELNNMRLRIDVVYSRAANMGYDQHFVQVCLPMGGLGKINCTFVSGSTSTSDNALAHKFPGSTDNQRAMLVVRCINGKWRNWKIAQTGATPDPEVKRKAKEIIQTLGFDIKFISYST